MENIDIHYSSRFSILWKKNRKIQQPGMSLYSSLNNATPSLSSRRLVKLLPTIRISRNKNWKNLIRCPNWQQGQGTALSVTPYPPFYSAAGTLKLSNFLKTFHGHDDDGSRRLTTATTVVGEITLPKKCWTFYRQFDRLMLEPYRVNYCTHVSYLLFSVQY